MVTRLLERQVSLLEYLTSSGAIFGGETGVSRAPSPPGFVTELLRLEACFSHEKRMEKIGAVFPHTFRLLGAGQADIVRDFVESCPSIDIGRAVNARQFHDFLSARWQHNAPQPPYLRDVAALEVSFAMARVEGTTEEVTLKSSANTREARVRRHPGVILLHCDYDVRQIFELREGNVFLEKRDTLLAVVNPSDTQHPKVLEVLPAVFNLLQMLDDWVDQSELVSIPGVDKLVGDLSDHGLVEVDR